MSAFVCLCTLQLRLALEVLIDGVQGAGDLGSVTSGDASSGESLRVADTVTLTHRPPDSVVMEWEGDPVGDAIADTVVAVILQVSAVALTLDASVLTEM